MPSNYYFNALSQAGQRIVASYAKRRGFEFEQLDAFLNPQLSLDCCVLPDADKVLARLSRAIASRERVLLYGDYDCDGICSTALMRRFEECVGLVQAWSLPNRQFDHYGLDLCKAGDLFERFRPTLLICLDCGTNSSEAIAWLRAKGTDTVVIDHHPPDTTTTDSVALVNPKVSPDSQHAECVDLCTAGLVLVLCDYLAQALGLTEKWDRATATMLAGLATIADAVPMTQLNRAIVKNALSMINERPVLNKVVGLAEIIPASCRRVSQRQLQFEIIPAINALGRLDSAEPGVQLLTTTDGVSGEMKVGEKWRFEIPFSSGVFSSNSSAQISSSFFV